MHSWAVSARENGVVGQRVAPAWADGGLRGTRWKPPFCCHGGGRNTQSGQGQRLRPASTHPRTGDSYRCEPLYILGVLSESHHHVARKTPPSLVDKWLPWVHVLISNLKRFILGTYHGVGPRYLQEYLDEFMYRFNRRWWEPQLPPTG